MYHGSSTDATPPMHAKIILLRRSGRGFVIVRHNRHMWNVELTAYLTHLRASGAAASTIRLRRMHLERAFSWVSCDSPWTVTGDELVNYVAAHDWKPETRKSVRSSLRGFYGWAVEVGHVDVDPSRRLPRVTVQKAVPHPTPTPVVDAAIDGAAPRTLLMLMLAAYAGMRRAEIAGLHADDIVGDHFVIRGKGGKVRDVPVHPLLAQALAGAVGFIFPGNDGGHLSPDRVGRVMRDALGENEWTAHSLRHRFATRAYAAERDLLTVQQLLGHSSVATTQIYTQVPDDARRRAIDNVA